MGKREEEGASRRCVFQFTVEWAMWGNMNALYAAVLMFIGGVVAATVELINTDSRPVHEYGAVTRWIVIGFSLMIFFCEYPRSARRNRGKNVERPGQKYIAPLLKLTFFVGRNYLFRFMLYLLAIIPCIFVLPAILGALCLFFACICYFIAALNGEQWTAPSVAWGPGSKSDEEEEQLGHTLPEAPTHPPPRPPPQLREGVHSPPTDAPPRIVKN